MQNNKKILIIHPEGNFNNNPNLTGIIEILTEQEFLVDVLCPKQEHYQFPINDYNRIIFYSPYHKIKLNVQDYGLIIGVDAGILEASILAKIAKAPLGYISYEIFFEDEIGEVCKNLERLACANIEFAVCQDKNRAKLLSKENRIPLEKIILIPVAGRNIQRHPKDKKYKSELNIPEEKKIALLIGSISPFTMIEEILSSVSVWPSEWVLLLHDRYFMSDSIKNKYGYLPNVYFSNQMFPNFTELHKFISSVDIGLAFYKPIENDIYCGKNLKNIGLASGKISTYLQCGIPVIINEIGEYSDIVRNNFIGSVIDTPFMLSEELSKHNSEDQNIRDQIYETYNKLLNLDNHVDYLLSKINDVFGVKKTAELDLELVLTDIYFNKLHSYNLEIKNLKKQIKHYQCNTVNKDSVRGLMIALQERLRNKFFRKNI